jgi:hypothetical protein
VAVNIISDFFNVINLSLFDTANVLLVVGFIVWEVPRSFHIISEEYTKDLYPEHGRVTDFVLLGIGLLAVFFFMINGMDIVQFLKKPGIIPFFLVLLVVIPLIIALSFFRRFFGRLEKGESLTIFLTHGFLDLMHTLFYISLAVLVIPALGFLLFG